MRDRAKAAQAVLRSAAYRGAHHGAGASPLEATGAKSPPGAEDGAGARRSRAASTRASPATVLALLGLLDLIRGG